MKHAGNVSEDDYPLDDYIYRYLSQALILLL